MRLADLILSAALVVLSIALSAGLRFGLTESERVGDLRLVYFISGFAWWGLLFALPGLAWVRQRRRSGAPV